MQHNAKVPTTLGWTITTQVCVESAVCVCVYRAVCFHDARRLWDISRPAIGAVTRVASLCHHGKTGHLEILLCSLKTRSYIRRMPRNIRPHTNTPQSLSLCSLSRPNCPEDASYLTSLPSPDTSPHKCARIATHTHTQFFLLFLLSGSVRTFTESSYSGKSCSVMCPPPLHCVCIPPNSPA